MEYPGLKLELIWAIPLTVFERFSLYMDQVQPSDVNQQVQSPKRIGVPELEEVPAGRAQNPELLFNAGLQPTEPIPVTEIQSVVEAKDLAQLPSGK